MDAARKPSLDLEKELTCSICTELLYQPLTLLDCLHTFCGACLTEWFSFQAATASRFTCPACRSAVRDSRHNATVVTLLDMLVAAHPSKARSDEDKKEMARKYRPGDQVPPKTPSAGTRTEDDGRLLSRVRDMSLRDGLRPPSSRRRHEGQSRSVGRDRSSENRSRRGNDDDDDGHDSDGRRRSTELRLRRDESGDRQVEHQSSLRSLIGSADRGERDIEREIDEFARQIQEEGLLDGLDLDNIDLSRDDELSRRVTEAYRRRQRRGRSRRQDGHGAASTSSSVNGDGRSSRPPPAGLDTGRSRRRTASGGGSSVAAAALSVGEATRPAARSQTELIPGRGNGPGPGEQRRSSSTPSVPASSPSISGENTNHASFAIRAPQWNPETNRPSEPAIVNPPRNRPQLYPEPSIGCSRCGKTHIEYEVHYSCGICAGGQWTICLGCYRAGKGCLHWFGFGHSAWNKWDKAQQLEPTTAPPHDEA
ncbi:hypothetical protein CDD80_5014 [Ophiocordyceps camponoti-rufipedis]|uniref:RING-type domain-containing protein n=1 Tax=Ophiocordyceps camponoti-rufipedis TaxID=2004952 RepID=A0A2C5YXI0_9HYPO|nr:hypothetical protein CDD80_5014 [Ophiocordyceps camponoti-rufipedis]